MPFCCERCRLIDLGRWLDEKQGLPIEPDEREEAEGGGAMDRRRGRVKNGLIQFETPKTEGEH